MERLPLPSALHSTQEFMNIVRATIDKDIALIVYSTSCQHFLSQTQLEAMEGGGGGMGPAVSRG